MAAEPTRISRAAGVALIAFCGLFAGAKLLAWLGMTEPVDLGGMELVGLVAETTIIVLVIAGFPRSAGLLGVITFVTAGVLALAVPGRCACAGSLFFLDPTARVWLSSLGGVLGATVMLDCRRSREPVRRACGSSVFTGGDLT